MHAVDRLARMHLLMQRLQHQSVPPPWPPARGVGGIVIAVEIDELRQRSLRLGAGARHERDPVISLGAGHGIADSSWRESRIGCAGGSSIRPCAALSGL